MGPRVVRTPVSGLSKTELSLSQKPDTPRVVDFWMSALAGIMLFSAVFPTLSLHRTLESVCQPSVNPVKGLCETGSIANFSLGGPNTLIQEYKDGGQLPRASILDGPESCSAPLQMALRGGLAILVEFSTGLCVTFS